MRSSDMTGGSDHDYEPVDQGDAYNDHPEINVPTPLAPRVPRGIQMAGDVIKFPEDKATIMPNTTQVRNDMARSYMERTGIPASSKVIDIGPRLK